MRRAPHKIRQAAEPPRANPPRQWSLKRAWSVIGPGFIAGGADDDPTAIATYAQAGAQYGYRFLWTTVLTFPMMVATQFIAAKLALVHGEGLTGVLKRYYPEWLVTLAIALLIIANVINAGADLGAIAALIKLFAPEISIQAAVIPIALVILALLTLGSYRLLVNLFKWFTIANLAYIASALFAHPSWLPILKGTFAPHLSCDATYLALLVATLGGNVSPYIFFWQADLEVEGMKGFHPLRGGVSSQRLHEVAVDTNIGMLFSNLIIFFIEVATAETLFRVGHHRVDTAAQAAKALAPILGERATILWAVGMLGAAMVSIPALIGSLADAVCALTHLPGGLNRTAREAKTFYAVLGFAIIAGSAINFIGINPMRLLVISAAINGFLTPPLLVLMLRVSACPKAMGEHANGGMLKAMGWITVALMVLADMGMVFTWLKQV